MVAIETWPKNGTVPYPGIEDAGGPPLPHRSDLTWASVREREKISKYLLYLQAIVPFFLLHVLEINIFGRKTGECDSA